MVAVFAHDCVNDHLVTDQAFLNDTRRSRGGPDSLFFATFAGTLFSLGHQHEVFGRFNIELLAGLVTYQIFVPSALGADTLLWRAGDDFFHSRQVCRQFLTPRMVSWLTCFAQLQL